MLKIPVITGVNDSPLPPNFNNSRRGCNGSYVVQKHNEVVDVLDAYVLNRPSEIILQMYDTTEYVEIGEPITNSELIFTFSAEDQALLGRFVSGDSIEDCVPLTSRYFEAEALYAYTPPSIDALPNVYTTPHERFYGVEISTFAKYPLSSLNTYTSKKWQAKVVIGTTTDVNLTDPTELTTTLYNDFGLPENPIQKPATSVSTALKIFVPAEFSIDTCLIFRNPTHSFLDPVPTLVTLEKTSSLGFVFEVDYKVYTFESGTYAYDLYVNLSDISTIISNDTLDILTTLGDLLYVSPTGVTRLPRGTNGQVLSSNNTTGLAWVADSGGLTAEEVDDRVASLLTEGTNITLSYNDAAGTLTINSTASGGLTEEQVDDRVASLLVEGAGIDLTYDDTANTLTVASTITQYTDEQVDDRVASLLTEGTNITLSYNDAAGTLTINSPNRVMAPRSVSTSTTLLSTDDHKWIKASGDITIDVGTQADYFEAIIQNVGVGVITIGGLGVTPRAIGTRLTAQWGACHVYYDPVDGWTAVGALVV